MILVRHAEITEAGSDPPLSPQGQLRAELLASMLRDAHLDAIYVTQFIRTQQTAQPSADRFHLRPERIDGEDTAVLVDTLRRRASGNVLVVGHSNTIPRIVSMLGGPEIRIAQDEFDNLFILTISREETSILRLRYGNPGQIPVSQSRRNLGMLDEESRVMQINFVRSGGFLGAARQPVRGTITLKDDGAEVTSEASYHRILAPDETDEVRAGANPSQLSKAASLIAARTRGAGDLEQYQITVKTKDGKSHQVSLNTSGSSNELRDVPPEVAKFLRWLQDEAQKIQAHRNSGE